MGMGRQDIVQAINNYDIYPFVTNIYVGCVAKSDAAARKL